MTDPYDPEQRAALLADSKWDPLAGPGELEAFNRSGAREKCPAVPGVGVCITAKIITERLGKNG